MLSPAAKIRSKDLHDIAALIAVSLFSGVWYTLAHVATDSDVSPEILEFMALVGGALSTFKLVDKAEERLLTDADGKPYSLSNALKILNVVLDTIVKSPCVFLGAELAVRAVHPSLAFSEMGSTVRTLGMTIAAAIAGKESMLKLSPFFSGTLARGAAATVVEAATVMLAGHYLIENDAKTVSFGATLLLQSLLKAVYCSPVYHAVDAAQAPSQKTEERRLLGDRPVGVRQSGSWNPFTWLCPRRAPVQRRADTDSVDVDAEAHL